MKCIYCTSSDDYGKKELKAHISCDHLNFAPFECEEVTCKYARFATETMLINHCTTLHNKEKFPIKYQYSKEANEKLEKVKEMMRACFQKDRKVTNKKLELRDLEEVAASTTAAVTRRKSPLEDFRVNILPVSPAYSSSSTETTTITSTQKQAETTATFPVHKLYDETALIPRFQRAQSDIAPTISTSIQKVQTSSSVQQVKSKKHPAPVLVRITPTPPINVQQQIQTDGNESETSEELAIRRKRWLEERGSDGEEEKKTPKLKSRKTDIPASPCPSTISDLNASISSINTTIDKETSQNISLSTCDIKQRNSDVQFVSTKNDTDIVIPNILQRKRLMFFNSIKEEFGLRQFSSNMSTSTENQKVVPPLAEVLSRVKTETPEPETSKATNNVFPDKDAEDFISEAVQMSIQRRRSNSESQQKQMRSIVSDRLNETICEEAPRREVKTVFDDEDAERSHYVDCVLCGLSVENNTNSQLYHCNFMHVKTDILRCDACDIGWQWLQTANIEAVKHVKEKHNNDDSVLVNNERKYRSDVRITMKRCFPLINLMIMAKREEQENHEQHDNTLEE